MKGMGFWLTRRCGINGDKLAVIYNERRLTFNDLNRRANRLANGLLKLGVRRGDRVAGMLMNGNEILEAFFGCAKLGAVFSPINFRFGHEEVEYILGDSSARVFIYDEQLSHVAEKVCGGKQLPQRVQVGGKQKDDVLGYELLLNDSSDNEPGFDVGKEEIFIVIYTSGTTDRPKGATLTHENFKLTMSDLLNSLPMLSTDIHLTVPPLFHLGGMLTSTFPILYMGGTVIIQDKFEPVKLLETIEREKVSSVFLVPAMWLRVKEILEKEEKEYNISSLRICITGGAPSPVPLLEFYKKRGIYLINGYGMTETGGIMSLLDVENSIRKNESVGKPFLHAEVRIVDEDDRDVNQGEAGELLIRSPSVMKGYWNNPEATRNVLKDGWYYSGDIVRMDEEGFLYVVDRKKDMIITGGENVASTEVERVLVKHPAIKEVAVIGVPDEKWGEAIRAIVVLNDDISELLTIENIQEYCKGKLAHFKIPKYLKIVSELPRNPAGKILKVALRKI